MHRIPVAAMAKAALVALLLGACAVPDISQVNLPKIHTDMFAPPSFSEFMKRNAKSAAVGPQDLVDGEGRCADMAPPASGQDIAGGQAGPAAPAPARGLALEMTECEVVRATGQAQTVQIGNNERSERSVVMTYIVGARPGIYRFVGGRLVSIERLPEPPSAPSPAKKPPKRQVSQR